MRTSTSAKLMHVKTVNPARGGVYYYFDTGQTNAKGKPIYKRLPDKKARNFGSVYAALLAGRSRRENMASVLSLQQFIALYKIGDSYRRLKESSKKVYDIYLASFADAFNTAPASGIERADMVRLIDSMADRPGAANLQLKIVSALYAWGRSRGHVSIRPCTDIDPFELGEHPPWPIDLLEAGLASDDPLTRLSVHLLYYTGQRIGDVTMMRWTDFRAGRIEITQEKTGADVSIPPHPALAALLEKTPKQGLTILMRNGRPLRRAKLRDYLQAFAKKRGQSIVPHGLRKNAVNALLEAGCSVAETASITAQSLQVVEHYAKARDTRRLADSAILKWARTEP